MDEWIPPSGKPQVAHIVIPRIPWRTVDRTYCGRDPQEFKKIASLADAQRRWKEVGAKRAAYEFCVTCVETANRHQPWDQNPVAAVHYAYNKFGEWSRESPERDVAFAELRALAALVEAHREEFEQAVADLGGVVSLDALRVKRSRAAR